MKEPCKTVYHKQENSATLLDGAVILWFSFAL